MKNRDADTEMLANRGVADGWAVVPLGVLDLARFMCRVWKKVDDWAAGRVDGELMMQYPVVQGTANQISLRRIADQTYDQSRVKTAVDWMLKNPTVGRATRDALWECECCGCLLVADDANGYVCPQCVASGCECGKFIKVTDAVHRESAATHGGEIWLVEETPMTDAMWEMAVKETMVEMELPKPLEGCLVAGSRLTYQRVKHEFSGEITVFSASGFGHVVPGWLADEQAEMIGSAIEAAHYDGVIKGAVQEKRLIAELLGLR